MNGIKKRALLGISINFENQILSVFILIGTKRGKLTINNIWRISWMIRIKFWNMLIIIEDYLSVLSYNYLFPTKLGKFSRMPDFN